MRKDKEMKIDATIVHGTKKAKGGFIATLHVVETRTTYASEVVYTTRASAMTHAKKWKAESLAIGQITRA